jgi:hypothetical protein
MDETIECFEVRRDDLGETRLVSDPMPPPGEGQALLRIDRFGFSTNNITYGVAADLVGYWKFFPADGGWGRLPVWGFAEVVAGDVDGLEVGTRVFGYLPPATHLLLTPTRVSPRGFTDGAEHRAGLPAVYNRYQRTDADPSYDPSSEDLQAIFAPLFVTSFVLDDFLADNDDFGAAHVIVSSASSKTAAGMALCTSRRAGERPRVTGLTSAGNADFVDRLGVYDDVVAYDAIETIDTSVPTVFVDVAGNPTVTSAVHRHLGDRLTASWGVGFTHGAAEPTSADTPGPTMQMFFAPSQIEKRHADWGAAGYQERLGAAWAFLREVVDDWVDIIELDGLAALRSTYPDLVEGHGRPSEAYVVAVSASS